MEFYIYENSEGQQEPVKDGWSWPGFFFTWIWAFSKHLHGIGIIYLILWLLGFISAAFPPEFAGILTIIGLFLAILIGVNGNNWRISNLESQGYNYKAKVIARSPEEAIKEYTDGISKERSEEEPEPDEVSGPELSHSDKIIGVLTEPINTFTRTAHFPIRNQNWIIPILVLMIFIGITRSVVMLNEDVFLDAKQKQIERIEKMIQEGTLTQERGEQALNNIDRQMNFMRGPVGWIINIVSVLVFGLIFFFIVAGIYFLFIKFLLKGEGTYASVLVANGLTAYITILQVFIAAILTMIFGTVVRDTSLAALLNSDRATLIGWLFAKIDPISIWAFIVLSIGFAKMFKSKSTGNYYGLVFGLWLIGGILIFYIAKAVPFLSFLNM